MTSPVGDVTDVPIWRTALELPPLGPATRASLRVLARRWWVVLGSLLVLGITVGPRVPHCSLETKVDVAMLTSLKYANEGYPAWRADHPARACPMLLAELVQYTRGVSLHDPWGHPFAHRCVAGRMLVTSVGEDGIAATLDDIRSDR